MVNYVGAHKRVRAARGNASDQDCAHCGGRAAQWAYDHEDPNEITGSWHGRKITYSGDPNHYIPLCPKCHVKFDNDHRGRSGNGYELKTECPEGHPYDDANTRVDKRGRRVCRTCHRDKQRARYQRLRAQGKSRSEIQRPRKAHTASGAPER